MFEDPTSDGNPVQNISTKELELDEIFARLIFAMLKSITRADNPKRKAVAWAFALGVNREIWPDTKTYRSRFRNTETAAKTLGINEKSFCATLTFIRQIIKGVKESKKHE